MKIIVVEHHKFFSQALKRVLDKLEGIKILGIFQNGKACLEMIKEAHPDIVLLDIDLPGNDSFDTAKSIVETYRGIKIYGMSCSDDIDVLRKAFESGASGFFSKYEISYDTFNAMQKNWEKRCGHI